MPIQHHPDITTLMSCAAGSQPEALAAVVASHLALCAQCRAEVKKLEAIGGALFETLPEASLSSPAPLTEVRAREADGPPDLATGAAPAAAEIPYPLAARIGARFSAIRWRHIGPGLWYCPVPLSKGARGSLTLIKAGPGRELPEHGHGGEELTLLLEGSYTDVMGTFSRGDVADLDQEI